MGLGLSVALPAQGNGVGTALMAALCVIEGTFTGHRCATGAMRTRTRWRGCTRRRP